MIGIFALTRLGATISATDSIGSSNTTYDNLNAVSFKASGLYPVFVGLFSPSGTVSLAQGGTGSTILGNYRFRRDSTVIATGSLGIQVGSAGGSPIVWYPASAFWGIDSPSAGTYSYDFGVNTDGTVGVAINATSVKLVVFEMKF